MFFYCKRLQINTTTIDSTLKEHSLYDRFLFIKLDIEGHELKAIKGAEDTIKNYKPIIIIELSKLCLQSISLKLFLLSFSIEIKSFFLRI